MIGRRGWDDYFIPGTGVLRNRFTSSKEPYGVEDQSTLTRLEEVYTRLRMIELKAQPISGDFDYEHMKAIHRHLFQDIYDWAGEERTAPIDHPMVKAGHAYFPAGASLTQAAKSIYQDLANLNFLQGMDRQEFIEMLALFWGRVDKVHCFREGNTRAQFVFFSRLCDSAGFVLEAGHFAKGEVLRSKFIAARFHSIDSGDHQMIEQVLHQVISSKKADSLQSSMRSAETKSVDLSMNKSLIEAEGISLELECNPSAYIFEAQNEAVSPKETGNSISGYEL